MGFVQQKKSSILCPKCKACKLEYEESPGTITAYCQICGFRMPITNLELAGDYAKDDPAKALRMLIDGHQWENICKVLGGMAVEIPASGTFEQPKKKHKYNRRKHVQATDEQQDEIVRLKLAGRTVGQIVIKLGLNKNVVTYIIYEKRREDCKHLIKNNLPQLPHAKKGGKK
jgi:hypothetical protein